MGEIRTSIGWLHPGYETAAGSKVPCMVALRLEVDLRQRLDQRGCEESRPDLKRDLARSGRQS